jgi:2-amino-4-hydroxy-6-hydroxymethyldihydropteridine diphosphokinase
MKHKPVTVYLGLGSNQGDREQNLARAMDLLAQRVKIEKTSSLYVAEPVGYRDQPLFLNAVCRGQASLDPEELLGLVKRIEASLGRKDGFRHGPRPIDIDILFYGDSVVNLPRLVIPHPGVPDRAFVLVPLAEIAPDLVHPVNGRTVAEMAERVRDRQGVRLWCQEAWNV